MSNDRQSMLQQRRKTHGDYGLQSRLHYELTELIEDYAARSGTEALKQVWQTVDYLLIKISRIAVGDPMAIEHWEDVAGYAQRAIDEIKNEGKK